MKHYFEERFEARLPRALPPMTGRVLFYRYGPAIDSLLEEFQRVGSPFVIFEEDMALARGLRDRRYPVVLGNLDENPAALAGVASARAVVAVERGQEVFVEFNDAFRVRPDDVLFVCGTLASLDQFTREFQTAPVASPRV